MMGFKRWWRYLLAPAVRPRQRISRLSAAVVTVVAFIPTGAMMVIFIR